MSNVNDSDLKIDTEDSFPAREEQPTDTTLSLLISHAQCALRSLDLSRFAEPGITNVYMRQCLVDDFRRCAGDLLARCDSDKVPFHWFIQGISKRMDGVLQLAVLRPLQRNSEFVPALLPGSQILAFAADLLDRRRKMYSDPRARPWRWLEPLFFPWHALAVAMAEVCVRQESSVVEKYWPTIEGAYSSFQELVVDVACPHDLYWKPIENMMRKATTARDNLRNKEVLRCEALQGHIFGDTMVTTFLDHTCQSQQDSLVAEAIQTVDGHTSTTSGIPLTESQNTSEASQRFTHEVAAWTQYEHFMSDPYDMGI
ncbi:C6 zinc finger domain protein [Talaromyces pinophilus]|uniref:C6 zinc finger domain protein n=1 Tax=Talaromyces pinophilus TaxID=128442 RepID=A0A0B8N0C8_TALPI|nr:C6 zinc finger domain protein [Talaromyces pinophilus]